jgi:hypothetical protein
VAWRVDRRSSIVDRPEQEGHHPADSSNLTDPEKKTPFQEAGTSGAQFNANSGELFRRVDS